MALMLEANCYAVNCYNEDLCQPVLARKSGLLTNLSPRLSYITSRDEEGMSYIVKISIYKKMFLHHITCVRQSSESHEESK